MKCWEYAQTIVPAASQPAFLAQAGREGWELVSLMPFEAPAEAVPLLDGNGRLVQGPTANGQPMVALAFKREAGQIRVVRTWVSVGQGGPEAPAPESRSPRNGRCVGVGT